MFYLSGHAFKGISAMAIAIALLVSCGGSSNKGGVEVPPASPDLTIVASTPTDGATNVIRTIKPELSFSASLNSLTATSGNVKLNQVSTTASATLTVTGSQLTITPEQKLLPTTTYTVRVETGLEGTEGEKPVSARTISFTTANGVWNTTIQSLESGSSPALNPQIAFDHEGNAMTVWSQTPGMWTDILYKRYIPGSGWTTGLQVIPKVQTGNASKPHIAFDGSGNALAVWSQASGGGSAVEIWASRYTSGTGWEATPTLLDSEAGLVTRPQIVVDRNGNALAVWSQNDGTSDNIYANRYTAGLGWGTTETIDSHSGNAQEPVIAMDANGNATAVWAQRESGTEISIWFNRYTVGAGWQTTAQKLEAVANTDFTHPQVAMAPNGTTLAVWKQNTSAPYNIWANRYTPGTGWSTPELIEHQNQDADAPKIAIDREGNGMAVWRQTDGTRYSIWSNRFTASSGNWDSAPALVEANDAGTAYEPSIAFDGGGNAIAVWPHSLAPYVHIRSNRYITGSGWGTDQAIEPTNSASSLPPQIAIDRHGDAIAVWHRLNGVRYDAYAVKFE